MRPVLFALALLASVFARPAIAADDPAGNVGYYRFPTLRGDTVVFTAEGDLWRVGIAGGVARRLTTHPGPESDPALSPDGAWVAFSADYEGPTEVYLMPLGGGLPRRLTWDGERATVVGWTPAGEVLYATYHGSTLPAVRLVAVDPTTRDRRAIPLEQASDGVYHPDGTTLTFTRFARSGSYWKRYRGGRAQSLWQLAAGETEARPLDADYPGTSREPMWWQDRLVFVSDRDGTMNLWSMTADGGDLRQHTRHDGWDVKHPALDDGRVVYQLGADLHLFDLRSGQDRRLAITLASDFDQRRERWVTKPMDYLTAAHLSPSGDRVVLTARGQVFVAPVGQGRLVEAGRRPGVRYRSARFLPGGERLVVLSDQSGEVELWQLDARGLAPPSQLTDDGTVLRFDTLPSPDGRFVAYVDKGNTLWLLEIAGGTPTRIDDSPFFGFGAVSWSPDSGWLAYTVPAANQFPQIRLYAVTGGARLEATSDRFASDAAAWSDDGRWLYFLSDRHLASTVSSPWGPYAPQPYLDQRTGIFALALRAGERFPFAPATELDDSEKKSGDQNDDQNDDKGDDKGDDKNDGPPPVSIDAQGLGERLHEVPVPAGNYDDLRATAGHLYWLRSTGSGSRERDLVALAIGREPEEPTVVLAEVSGYELSADGKKLLVRKGDALYVADANGAAIGDLAKAAVDLSGWTFPLDPREEWRQMLVEAWRLHRDYFYDQDMHGVDWPAMLERYLPLVDRVTERGELSDIFTELIAELSASHHFVSGGDHRSGDDDVDPASLGATLERDQAAGGYRVSHLYRGDPDLPEERPPLGRPGVEVEEGDVILAINGVATLGVDDPGQLLRNQADRQVLLRVARDGEAREVVVEPISSRQERELRYDTWEHERRLMVEAWGEGKVGYLHLRAMGGGNYSEFARHYFPIYRRQGLVVDARHNRGGNIDSWILGFLLRKPWMWWTQRSGQVYRNMQFAFGGHMVVLCNEQTWSDGEAFCEGFRRLGLGPVVGNRTGGGEIWLTSSNVLVDRGIATAAEFGVYGPEGEWLIEGHGVEPDIAVDNLPLATFRGDDAQLRAAVEHLKQRIAEDPPAIPQPPPPKDLSVPNNRPPEDG